MCVVGSRDVSSRNSDGEGSSETMVDKPCDAAAAPAAAAKSLQSFPTLCGPTDGSPPGSPIPGMFQAGVLEWGAIAFSKPMCYLVSNKKELVNMNTLLEFT